MRIEHERDGTRRPITTVDEWFGAAPPKGGADHWVAGRSARELAEAWCGPGPCVPDEVARLLGSRAELREVVVDRVLPEHRIRFDGLPGEPRNADLAIVARSAAGPVAVTVEGKADEPFDRPVRAVLEAAVGRIGADQPTGGIARIQALSAALLPPWRDGLAHLGDIRYQLLTGVAGTIAWARELGARHAIFVVHEFVTDRTADEKHARNAADLTAFLRRLSTDPAFDLSHGALAGPFRVPGNEWLPAGIQLFAGKATRYLRRAI